MGLLVKKGAYWKYHDPERELEPMTNIAARLRARRAEARNRRALNRAIDTAATATVRQELIAIAQAHQAPLR